MLALERHATSKIGQASDLGAISTLGFRGEALPSIASVSKLTLRTRPADRDAGVEIQMSVGVSASMREIGAPVGTSVDVVDIFFNLPARRKFLKSDGAESAQISKLVTQLALGYPAVGFTLRSGDRTMVACPPAASLVDRFHQVYGERPDLIPIEKQAGGLKLVGFVAALTDSGPGARTAECLRQWPHREGPDDRACHRRGVQRRDDQSSEPRGPFVSRDVASAGRCQRPSDQGGSAIPRAVARARGDAAGAGRGTGPRPRARTAAAARRLDSRRTGRAHDPGGPARRPGWR